MKKFLKVFYKFNKYLSFVLAVLSLIIFGGAAFNIPFIINPVTAIQEWSTFGLFDGSTDLMLLTIASCLGFFINQYIHSP